MQHARSAPAFNVIEADPLAALDEVSPVVGRRGGSPRSPGRPPPVETGGEASSFGRQEARTDARPEPRSGDRRGVASRSLSPSRSRSPRGSWGGGSNGGAHELDLAAFDGGSLGSPGGAFSRLSPGGGASPALDYRRAAPAQRARAGALWGLASFAFTEALGERHSAGLDDSVPEAIDNFLAVPARFERFVAFGMLSCLDTFLYTVTFLPLRSAVAVGWAFCDGWRYMVLRTDDRTRLGGSGFSRARAYDLARFGTVVLVNLALKQVPLSRAYHWIRGQNTIKLYVIVGIMEVFDRLLCAFSQDALDGFYLTTRSCRSFSEWRRVSGFLCLVNVVVVCHSLLLYTHLTTLNVVVNAAEDSALVALLVSNNFSEIKSAVFKKYNATNLFDVACSDVCERFKLVLFLCLLTLLSWSQVAGDAEESSTGLGVVAVQSLVVLVFEVVADWLKHAFVAKFNKLDASVYDAYASRLARDVVTGRSKRGLALDHTHAVTRRLGFAVLPLACVSLRYLSLALNWLTLSLDLATSKAAAIVAAFAVLLFQLKLLTSICLAGLATDYGPSDANLNRQTSAPAPNSLGRNRPSNSFDGENRLDAETAGGARSPHDSASPRSPPARAAAPPPPLHLPAPMLPHLAPRAPTDKGPRDPGPRRASAANDAAANAAPPANAARKASFVDPPAKPKPAKPRRRRGNNNNNNSNNNNGHGANGATAPA